MFSVTKRELEDLRATYKKGMTVQLDYMNDPQAPEVGTKGKIDYVDDAGTVHVNWDNGGSLGLVPSEGDCFHIIDEKENSNNSFINQIKNELSEEDFNSIKNTAQNDYIEGITINTIWTYDTTKVPMIIDIRESNLSEERMPVSLESWIYFLKDGGDINEELDYEHYDGRSIITFDELQKCDYNDFIKAVYDNANSYLLEYEKYKSESNNLDEMEIEM